MDKSLILAKSIADLRKQVADAVALSASIEKQVGPQGPKGDKGDKGDAGKNGRDGLDGKAGKDGINGKDGKDGLDGVGVTNAYIDFDNSLVIVLSNGTEVNAGYLNQEAKEAVVATFKQGAATINELLPSQVGNENKVLATDGTNVYWETSSSGTGAVTSVNGYTGTVVLTATDVGAQTYNADTVIDPSYVHTDNNYTNLEKNKLAGIQAGAEVNVNADWNATSGDAQILNKPTLFDPANPGDIGTATHGNGTFLDVTVTGDLTVQGTITTVNTSTLDIEDPLMYLANANTGDSVDIGFVGPYVSGTHKHTGLIRDASDGKWKFFSGVTTEPTNTVDLTSATYDTLKIGTLETTSSQVSNWNSAYGWGNHATVGYLTSYTETDPLFIASPAYGITTTKISNWDTTYGWGNHASAGYLTSYTETDPVFSASPAHSITTTNINNWNTAYGWGNHASAGYLTSGSIGVTVQAYDADLTSWAGLAPSSKQDTLVSGTNIKTINGNSILGSGNLSIGGSGTVTSVAALTIGTTGTDLSSTVANSTTTPVITLNVPTASATNRGALSSTDWSTFNNKQDQLISGTNIKTVNGVSLLGSGDVGSLLAKSTSIFTTGSAQTYTAPANTEWVKVTVVGPGGNGGAATNQRATGGGGGAVAIKWLSMTAGQTLTYTVGTAAGTASTVSSGTLVITTISAGSGANGTGTAYAASITAGAAGGTATGGDINITGGQGGHSYGSGTTITTNFSGKGGDCPGFGSGGNALAFVATAGVQGNGYGAGGGGAIGSNTAANGRGGVIIFEAY